MLQRLGIDGAAAVTVRLCRLAGFLLAREITRRDLPDIVLRSDQRSGMLAPMIAISPAMVPRLGGKRAPR